VRARDHDPAAACAAVPVADVLDAWEIVQDPLLPVVSWTETVEARETERIPAPSCRPRADVAEE